MTDLETVSTHLGQARHENATLSRQLATTEARAEETTKRADDLKAELQHAHTTNAALLDALKPAKAAPSVPPLDQIDLGL
jgi:phage shock protein A